MSKSVVQPPRQQAGDKIGFIKLSWVAYVFNVDPGVIHRLRKRGHLPGCRLIGLRTWVMPEALYEKLRADGLPYYDGKIKSLHP